MTSANMVLNRLEPMTALMIMARIRDGNDRIISEIRIITLSTQPPKLPATAPRGMPLRGGYFLLVQKVTKDTLRGRPPGEIGPKGGRFHSRPPPETPAYGGARYVHFPVPFRRARPSTQMLRFVLPLVSCH